MLVYRTDETSFAVAPAWTALRRLAATLSPTSDADAIVSVLIEAGELESAVADAIFEEADGLDPRVMSMRRVTLAAARLLTADAAADPDRKSAALDDTHRALASIDAEHLPAHAVRRVSEGYVYYALHPLSYAAAARRFADRAQPRRVVCLGIRSIGTSLSAVVAAALQARGIDVDLHTLRPRGHPFDRQLRLMEPLERQLRTHAPASMFAIVDEGPGLSGTSFASVAVALHGLGIPRDRIALFPSWDADASGLRSAGAREAWSTHVRYSADVGDAGTPADEGIDVSAGRWRLFSYASEAEWPAVQPQHEVRKVWVPEAGCIVRFAGLGRYGQAKRIRADALAGAGLGPPPGSLSAGYLPMPFVAGVPVERLAVTAALLDAMAGHLAFLVNRFPAERNPSTETLHHMTETNLRLAFGDAAPRVPDVGTVRGLLDGAPCAAIDARMLPHEWIDTADAFIKVDALDHHAGHFFPGTQDAGWDIAAATVEFELGREGIERLATRYAALTGDAGIRRRLPFYRTAYLAFRLGYVTMCAETLGRSDDGRRFAREAERYRRLLGVIPSAP